MTEYQTLTDDSLDAAVRFMRDANPFAQRTWGWDTGRFIDWRWGSHAAYETDHPGWFAENCRAIVESGTIRALLISEYGEGDLCILTREPEPELVAGALNAVITDRRSHRRDLHLEAASRSAWLRNVFVDCGLDEQPAAAYEWEYDLSDDRPTAEVPEGFSINSLKDAVPGDRERIAECIAAAFDSEGDIEGALASLETNPLFLPELSVFVRGNDGRVAAYCRGTVDPDNGICGIDPVCTHPDFQRLGLGKAVVLECFTRQRLLGGAHAFIGSDPDPAPGNRLYRSLGPRDRIAMSSWTLAAP